MIVLNGMKPLGSYCHHSQPVEFALEETEWLRTVLSGSPLEPATGPLAAEQRSQENHPMTSTKNMQKCYQ